jgi:hypothetical protein
MRSASPILVAAAALAALAGLPRAAAAQDTVTVGVRGTVTIAQELPRQIADELIAFYNRPGTIRFSGRVAIPAGRRVDGDIAVLSGPIELAGTVEGDLVVINGDVNLAEGAHVTGNLTVVGGIADGVERARVDGVVATYAAVLRYRRTDEGIEYVGTEAMRTYPTPRRLALPGWKLGNSEIFVSARAYNRIQALPLVVGPRITTGGSNPLRAEAFFIYHTQAGFDPESGDVGYEVRLRQWLFGHREFWIEAGLQSIVDPIERWQLTNLENSLTTFLFRRDYRDYYEREGWYALFGLRHKSLFASLEFRDENHNSRSKENVWTIFFNTDEEFRPNAAIDGGDLQSVIVTLGIDSRNDKDDPRSGWYNQLSIEQAVGGKLSGAEPDFTSFFLDLRRYFRVSYNSVLALQLAGAGPLGHTRLPAQRQHYIGGAGSLPGYDMMEFDCGARADPGFGTDPLYGCQRLVLFRAEYRSGLDFHFRWDYDETPGPRDAEFDPVPFTIEFEPRLVFFYDAGAAWSTDDDFFEFLKIKDNWLADLGAGVDFGGWGFYFAYPLVGAGELKFIARLAATF